MRKRRKGILGLAIALVFIISQLTGVVSVYADPPEEKVTGTIRYTSGTSSYLTATYSGLSPLPNEFGIGNSAYNAWCVDNTRTISTGTNYAVTVYSPYDGTWVDDASIDAHSNWVDIPWDDITWIVNNRSGYTKDEVQNAIWHLTDGISVSGNALALINSIPSTVAPGETYPKQILVNWMGNDRQLLVTEYTPPSFTVTYNSNGGSTPAPVDSASPYYPGEEVTVLGQGEISWAHHTFEGWNTTSGGSGTDYDPADTFDMGYANVELFAQWEPIDYTVTYDPGDHGTFDADVTEGLHFGDDTPVAPETPGETGWEFNGWSPKPTETVEGNATYTAQWIQVFTVTYDPGDHGDFTAVVHENLHNGDDTPAAPSTPGQPGWSFSSWSPTPTTLVSGSAVYVAQWTQDEYTVTFEPGSQGTFETQTTTGLHYGDDTPTAPETTGNAGFTFTGWNPLVNLVVTGSAIYVAQWDQDIYTVTYDPGLYGTFDAQVTGELLYGDDTPAPPEETPSEPGWLFDGWSPVPSEIVTGNATYIAQWVQIEYTVTYEPGDHGTFETQITEGLHYNDDTPDAPITTGDEGWAFNGWTPSVESLVTGNATYTALWTLIPVDGLDITKSVNFDDVFVGTEIQFTITVTNTGNTVLYSVNVVDEMLGVSQSFELLDPQQSEEIIVSYTTTSEDVPGFTNTAVSTALGQTQEVLRDEASVSVTVSLLPPPPPPPVLVPGISVSITPDAALVESGTPVTFTMNVTNTGLLVLYNVEVVNTDLDFSTTIPILYVLETQTFTVTKTLTEAGDFSYTVTATGTAPSVSAVSDTDVTTVGVFTTEIPENPPEEPVIPPDEPVPGDTVENPQTGVLPASALAFSGIFTLGAGIIALIKRKKEDDGEE
ncbi:MAG TPA: InlB B-repeat-containing protein [Clostridia bacterium]|nr:InlB B-repeat-containing protein [Clostridia bacterium]